MSFHGCPTIPTVAIESTGLAQIAAAMGGIERLDGVQPKFSADISGDGKELVPTENGAFLVKLPWPHEHRRPRNHLPENEHASMCMARLVGIDVASCALLPARNGRQVYVTKRFDRATGEFPVSYALLDFCRILELSQEQKYDHPATRYAQVVIDHVVHPTAVDEDLRKLFRLLVFSYWIGNGDLHLKNVSLVDRSGGYRLAPAYDLACSYVFGDESLALFIQARQKDLPRRAWLRFAPTCHIPKSDAEHIIDEMLAHHSDCVGMLQRSALPEAHRVPYRQCLTKRGRALSKR